MEIVNKPSKIELENYYKNHSRKTTNRINLPKNLNTCQKEYLIGNLLGDGHLRKIKNKFNNSSFTFKQKQENSEYVKLLYEIYKPFSKNIYENIKSKKPCTINNWNGEYCYSCVFETFRHPIFTYLESKWYLRDNAGNYILSDNGNRIKVVPKDLSLTWDIAAIWACDDGCNHKPGKEFILCTECFPKDDVNFLAYVIKRDLTINAKIVANRIFMYGKNAIAFIEGISTNIPWNCFAHKVTI